MTINFIFNRAHEEEAFKYDKFIICFSASWCNPCKNFAPFYSLAADKYPFIKFFNVDIDDSPDFANKFNITSIPTFITFNYNNLINKYSGTDIHLLDKLLQEL